MNSIEKLREDVERWSAQTTVSEGERAEAQDVVGRLRAALNRGEVRSAERIDDSWHAVEWVKKGILLAFRAGQTISFTQAGQMVFFDRDTLPLRDTRGREENVRIVSGGSSIRDGAFVGTGVVIMPPAFINIGAYVDDGALIDSHALVGSCAQVGKRVHLSAGAQLGGVLEPIGLRPVIVEDDAMVGGNCGVFEGTLIGRRAVLAPGVNLTASTTLYDLVHETTYRATAESPLTVPEGAVVVPGTRPAKGIYGESNGVSLYAPVIVKYRDERTDAATVLEEILR